MPPSCIPITKLYRNSYMHIIRDIFIETCPLAAQLKWQSYELTVFCTVDYGFCFLLYLSKLTIPQKLPLKTSLCNSEKSTLNVILKTV